jgi:hypothetical protein
LPVGGQNGLTGDGGCSPKQGQTATSPRRQLETGEAATIHDIAEAEKVTDRFVSRMVRLAYLSPDVLERLVILRDPPSESVIGLIEAVNLPWAEQQLKVFDSKTKQVSRQTTLVTSGI